MSSKSRFQIACAAGLLGASLTFAGASAAQDLTQEERAAGEKLYEEGARLLEEKRYAEACPLLARAVDAVRRQGVGGILALAECREGEGRLGSAWTLYREAASKAELAGQTDRVRFAREGEARVAPRVHYVVIENGSELARTEGLEVRVQGASVSPAVLTAPIAADPGAFVVEVRTRDREPATVRLEVTLEPGKTTARLALGAPRAVAQQLPRQPPTRDESAGLGSGQVAGLVIGSVGLASSIAGAVLFAVAKASYPNGCEAADGSFDRSVCGNADDIDAASHARTLGDASAATFYPGLGLVAVGVIVFVASPWPSDTAGDTTAKLLGAAPGADIAGVSLLVPWR